MRTQNAFEYKYLFGVIYFLNFAIAINAQGFYQAVGSRIIRPNSGFHLAISVQATTAPSNISAIIQGVSKNGSVFQTEDYVFVQPYTTRICNLNIGDIKDGDYKLILNGRGGIDFQSSYPLKYVEKSYSVFIQTDKPVYSPGMKILFRVIILNSQLKPAADIRDGPIQVDIRDGKNNIIKQWKNIFAIKGIFTGELELSNSPVLGDWHIQTTIRGQSYKKKVQVANYVIPQFLIEIDAPKHITFEENILSTTINTRYIYGKDVNGEATITVYPTYFSGVIQPILQIPVRKVVGINGSVEVKFDIANELKLDDEYERILKIDVTVEEALTGRRENNSFETHLHKYEYKIDFIKSAEYFKPGLPYISYVRVSNHDENTLKLAKDNIDVYYTFNEYEEKKVQNIKLDKDGVGRLKFDTPAKATNSTILRIEVQYFNLKEKVPPIPPATSYSNNFLQISSITEHPTVNSNLDILVNCTEPMSYINYVVLSKGDVLIANTLQVYNQKEFQFHFTVNYAMVPQSHVIVSYARPDGELIGDTLDIEIEGLFQNFLDVQVNPVETEPDFDVDLTVRSQPNSYIGLLAVDENVFNLGSGFDLTYTDVVDDLNKYDAGELSPYKVLTVGLDKHFAWKPGANNVHNGIYQSGGDLLTNTHINRQQIKLEDIYARQLAVGTSTVKPDRGLGVSLHSITRPPLAGPYAFSRIPKLVWNKPTVHLKQHIQNTWLFYNFSSGYEGKLSMRKKVPPTLTKWTISGFSLDPFYGLGLTKSSKKIKISKTLVINMDLPLSLKRNEILSVPVVIENHQSYDTICDVTMHNPDLKFQFYTTSKNNTNPVNALYKRKKLKIRGKNKAYTSFMIKPIHLGPIEIKITANTPKNQDSLMKILRVVPEGTTEYYTKTILINLQDKGSFKKNINFTLPKNTIPDSERIEVSAVGNIFGPTLMNLEKLIRLPTNCGEQNLVHLMPIAIILKYLRNTRQITPSIENDAINIMEKAYQQQLSYKKPNGSFSIFEYDNQESNVWITAYVASAFRLAKEFIYIDENIIKESLDWLEDKQQLNGSFVESGKIIHHELQNRNGKSLALTAFTLIAFIENQLFYPDYRNVINKGLDYIARNIDNQESTYAIAICSYVLHLARHPSKQGALNLLDARSKSDKDRRWWTQHLKEDDNKNNPWNYLPKSIDIEISAYGLLSFIEGKYLNEGIPILNWLIEQQNDIGGFTSSQDSSVGLLAIYKLITKLDANVNMQIEFMYRRSEVNQININKNNALIVQKYLLGKDARQVNVTAQGTGLALFKVSYQYNMNTTGPWPMFTLDPQIDKNSNKDHLQISVCTSFVSNNLTDTSESNMVSMEVNLPSGFTVDTKSLPSLEFSQNVQKVETMNDLTKVILYFNNLTNEYEFCPTISAFKTHQIAGQRQAPIIVYDYYNSARRARQFYGAITSNACDICEDNDCKKVCSEIVTTNESQQAEIKSDGSSSTQLSWTVLLILVTFFII